MHPNRVCPSSDYGHATHLLEAQNAISSHLIIILSAFDIGGGGASCLFFVDCSVLGAGSLFHWRLDIECCNDA